MVHLIVFTIVKRDPPDQNSPGFSNDEVTGEILALKDELNACILVHNYQRPEIYEVADRIGDSLELALAAKRAGKETIVFCGVDFMAETAKIVNPGCRVLHPVPSARCPMAHMVTPEKVAVMREKYPDATVVSYVNTTTELKSVSDLCCTSANAVDIVRSAPSDDVIFLPDLNLAAYVQRYTTKRIIPGRGNCYVHDAITPAKIDALRSFHPGSSVIAHPECRPEVLDRADAICSTGGMIAYCKDSSAGSFIIGTEVGMIERLKREIPEKKFFPAAGTCGPMKEITLGKILASLRDGTGEVTISPDLAAKALVPLERMLERSRNRRYVPCRSLKKTGLGFFS